MKLAAVNPVLDLLSQLSTSLSDYALPLWWDLNHRMGEHMLTPLPGLTFQIPPLGL